MEKIIFKLGDTTYKAKSLNQLSINEHQEVVKVINAEGDELQKIKELIHLLAEIPYDKLDIIRISSFILIDFKKLLSIDTTKIPLRKSYRVEGKDYYLREFNEMKYGKWIDLNYFIKQKENTMSNTIARMIIPDDNINDTYKLSEIIRTDLNIMDGLTLFDTIINWRADLIKQYEGLFEPPTEEEDEDEESVEEEENVQEDEDVDGGWSNAAYELAENLLNVDAIKELPLIEVLNYMSYKKQKAEKGKAAYDKANNIR